MNRKPIKCDMCGQFIAYKDWDITNIHFIPDTEYTIEETIFRCHKCVSKYGKIYEKTKEKENETKEGL